MTPIQQRIDETLAAGKKVFFTSDTHFGHEAILVYEKRPWSNLVDMNTGLASNWNAVVSKEDLVFFVGDFAMGQRKLHGEYCQQLNGYKVCVMGNHDQTRTKMLAVGFDEAYSKLDIVLDGLKLHLQHVPVGSEAYDKDRWVPPSLNEPAELPYDYFLCGHVHSLWARAGRYVNVGVDVRDWTPRELKELLHGNP